MRIVKSDMEKAEDLPPLDARLLDFTIEREARRTLVDLIREGAPTTIMGVLLRQRDGVTVDEIAEQLDEPAGLVSWNIKSLEREDLCVRLTEDGVTRIMPFAAYTERNNK
jgi:hypothetical protein